MSPRHIVKPLRKRPWDWSYQERFHYVARVLGIDDDELGAFLRRENLREAPMATWIAEARARGLDRSVLVPRPSESRPRPTRPVAPPEDPASSAAAYQRHLLREELREARDELDDLDDVFRR